MQRSNPEHIAISKSKGIHIDWDDSHHSEYGVAYLRDECPCATCTGSHGTTPKKTNYSQPSAFVMFQPALKMNDVESIGNYAIKIHWSDGHSTGLYSYDHLRRICPCSVCQPATR